MGERAVLILENVFRLEGVVVSQNLGAEGVLLGFRPDDSDEVCG